MKLLSASKLVSDFKRIYSNQYFGNTVWLLAENGMRLVSGLFVGVWVVRYLGPEDFGVLSYASSFVVVFAALGSLGVDNILVRELIVQKKNRDYLIGSAFAIKLIGSAVLVLFVSVALWFSPSSAKVNIIVYLIVLSNLLGSFNVISLYFQSQVLSKYQVYASIISIGVSITVKIHFILTERGLFAFASVYAIESLVFVVSSIFFYRYNGLSLFTWKIRRSTITTLFSDSWPLLLSGISISLSMRIDQVMLNYFLDTSSVGLYAAGVKIAEVLVFIPAVIGKSIYPKIVALDMETEQGKLKALIKHIFYLLLAISIGVLISSKFLVDLLYGNDYLESQFVVGILVFTIPLTYLGTITNKLLLKFGLGKVVFVKQFSLALLNIIANLILIPKYGIIGAAFATLIASLVTNLFFELFVPGKRWLFGLKMNALLLR
ncbi:MAG: flippase [Tunicatimonas sp.]|uniref:flippase n=1 Tax=Tunicatimonas sp. TaxID=1940096 RepID=UPI003C7944A2